MLACYSVGSTTEWDLELTALWEEQKLSKSRVSDLSSLPPETALAFTELADAVTRDYVRYEFVLWPALTRL